MASKYGKKSDYSDYRAIGFPVRHRRKVPFYPMLSVDMEMRSMMSEIHELDSILGGFMLSEQDYYDLVLDAYSSNIHWSTKIEGNRMTFDEVRTLATEFTAGGRKESPNGPTQEILNHLGFLFKEKLGMPWSLDTILFVHRALMTGVGETAAGKLRDADVSVIGSDGTEFFIACPKGSVEEELLSLVDWVNGSPFGDIVTATLFFHEFESIHPFADGNGRTGRVLFQSLLREMGLANCGLCKFEQEMLQDSATYYGLLSYTDQTGNYTPLARYVTESILLAYRKAAEEFSAKDRLKDMDENTKHIARMAKSMGEFAMQDASGWLPVGEAAVRRKLDSLVDSGILGKEGKTRGMRYVFLDPFRSLKAEL